MRTETPVQAGAAQELPNQDQPVIDAGEQARIDAYTDAVTSGASPAEVARLEAEMRGTSASQQETTETEKPAEETTQTETQTQQPEQTETETTETEKPEETKPEETGGKPSEQEQIEGKLDDRVRLNHLSEDDKATATAVFALTRKGVPYAKAYEIVTTAINQQAESVTPEVPQHITDLETKLASVRAKIKEEKKDGVLASPDLDALEDERSVLISQIAVARNTIEMQASVRQELTDAEFQRTRQSVLNSAVNTYPAMKDRTSTQWLVAKGIGEQMRDPAHPDHARLFQPDAPLFIAQKAAEKLGIKPAGAEIPGVQTQQTQQTSQAQQKAKPGPARGSTQSAPPPPAKTRDQIIAESQAHLEAVLEGRAKPRAMKGSSVVFLG